MKKIQTQKENNIRPIQNKYGSKIYKNTEKKEIKKTQEQNNKNK